MPYIVDPFRAQSTTKRSVGNGQCVSFVHAAVNIPPSSLWYKGALVKGDTLNRAGFPGGSSS